MSFLTSTFLFSAFQIVCHTCHSWIETVTFFLPVWQVIQWCTHHKDDPPPPEDDENKEKRTDDIPVWDQEFLKVDQGTLFELILVRITPVQKSSRIPILQDDCFV